MSLDQTTANRLVLIAVLRKMLARLDDEQRAAVDMDPGDRKTAVADGRRIGHVLLTDPKEVAKVDDGDVYLAWVEETHPDEIEEVVTRQVRSSFLTWSLRNAINPETGEVIPGIGFHTGKPVLTVKADEIAEEAIRAELAATGMTFAGLLDALSAPQITDGTES